MTMTHQESLRQTALSLPRRTIYARMLFLGDTLAAMGLLATVFAVPLYFNIDDLRIFEPDKATLLRDAAALLGTLALLRLFLRLLGGMRPHWPSPRRSLSLLLFPLATLVATATSILPAISFFGSYARAQGGLTTLAYLTLSLLACTLSRPQRRRLLMAMALSGTAPAAYGWIQHFGHDPLPWQQADLSSRVPGSLGNPIFLGALLCMTIPLALLCLIDTVSTRQQPTPSSEYSFTKDRLLYVSGWLLVLLIQLGGLYFTDSRGPALGMIAALMVMTLLFPLSQRWRRVRRRFLFGIGALGTLVLLLNLLAPGLLSQLPDRGVGRLLRLSPATSGTSEVRLLIWGPALQLVQEHPLLGCGPDTLMTCYYRVYPTTLRHLEAPNAVPDRTHDIYLDVAAETGLLGLCAFLLLIGATIVRLLRAVRMASQREQLYAVGLLAALTGHLVEGLFGIAIVSTALLTWLIVGLSVSLVSSETLTSRILPWSIASLKKRGKHQTRPPLLVLVAVGLTFVLAGAATIDVLGLGARQSNADMVARQASDLETVALGNSGQAALPPGRQPQPILALRQFAAAHANLQQALALAPQQEEYALSKGRLLVEWAQAALAVGGPAGQEAGALYARALLDFGQAAKLNPLDPDPLRDTGKTYERWAGLGQSPDTPQSWDSSRLQSAAAAFARAALLAPHHPDPLVSGSQVALWQGQSTQALTLAQQAVSMDRQMGDAYRVRAEAELALGSRHAALVDWQQALHDPNLGERGLVLAHLALAEATWATSHCRAVQDAHAALLNGGLTPHDTRSMQEIMHLAPALCPALAHH